MKKKIYVIFTLAVIPISWIFVQLHSSFKNLDSHFLAARKTLDAGQYFTGFQTYTSFYASIGTYFGCILTAYLIIITIRNYENSKNDFARIEYREIRSEILDFQKRISEEITNTKYKHPQKGDLTGVEALSEMVSNCYNSHHLHYGIIRAALGDQNYRVKNWDDNSQLLREITRFKPIISTMRKIYEDGNSDLKEFLKTTIETYPLSLLKAMLGLILKGFTPDIVRTIEDDRFEQIDEILLCAQNIQDMHNWLDEMT